MRRQSLDLLRCPKCHAGSLVPDAPTPERSLAFGPARCLGCGSLFPVHDGLVDLVGGSKPAGVLQAAMEQPWVARAWERTVRPTLDLMLTRGKLDHESEYTILKSLLDGEQHGPLLDLGCGAGMVLRRLSRDFRGITLIGMDVSRPMLEEAMAQVREHAEAADFVRAQAPELPFTDASLGAIVAVGFIHFVDDLDALLSEVARVLKPRGRFVATTYEAGFTQKLHRGAGLHPRSETELRDAAARAGLVAFERVRVSPFLLWKAERP